MTASRGPRPSTDEEAAPLLRDPETEENDGESGLTPPTFAERHLGKISSVAQEPLTPLTKVLLVVVLVFLLLSSIFIGLFAGAQHKLNTKPQGGDDGEETPPPSTFTVTATTTGTTTAITTTTEVRTTTTAYTTTAPPVPVPTHAPPSKDACFTPECIVLSADILSSLDTSQDPCENFYEFANGGWLKSHPLPADKGSFGTFEGLAQKNRQLIEHILESNFSTSGSDADHYYETTIQRQLKGLYASCLDEELLDARGEAPLVKFVQTVRDLYSGKRTTVDEPELYKSIDGLTAAVAFLHSRGIGALFSIDIEGDVGVDPNFMTLWFSQPEFGLPSKEYYEEEAFTSLYREVLERLLVVLPEDAGDDEDEDVQPPAAVTVNEESSNRWPPWPWPPWDGDEDDDHKKKKPVNRTERARLLSTEVVTFEKRIAKASLDLDILYQDPVATYNPTPFSDITEALPQIHLSDYIATFTPRNFPPKVIVTYPAYISSLSEILSDTSSDVVEAYLVTRAALALAPHLGTSTESWLAVRSLEEKLKGIKKGAIGERSEFCVGKVESALGFAAGRYFVNETFGGASREKSTKVITDIVKTFKKSLQNLEWMDKESADAAAQKADAIRVKVGFPTSPNTLDPRSIALYYGLVSVDEHEFFENMLSSAVSDEYKEWQQLGKQRDLAKWEMFPSTVNAYFNPPSNEIVFPAGILQPPFFSQEWPSYLSYGSFGEVAAHELTHAFDSAGRLYNQDGKLEQWWTNATSEGFNVRQECISKQYSSYWVDDGQGGRVYVNGNLTSGENIGDSGLIQAYRAWKAQLQENTLAGVDPDYLLPGLNYTREQLFFISFARAWAQNIKPASAVARVRSDPHSPNRFRVEGTVSNVPEFAQAFNCSAKAKLNPPQEKRCVFW
ncbi:hypothetical protein PLICRDRAFT_141150 [Plicaturopsis crispa FD-325 SS-3]|nr:hypothetical protein PLICRDRAFT_141150 [Plicaturopsis crispa FD-325 SS-3]